MRLAALAAVAAAAALLIPVGQAASARPSAQTATGSEPKPSIVLVHGAWADSSSWDAVVSELQNAGYTVYVPTNPLQGLRYDSAYLADFLRSIPGPIILVSHSYGGAAITNAATGDQEVKAMVYVDAFAPARGETLGQLVTAKPGPDPADGQIDASIGDPAGLGM
jgi:pimeloyl-ACP methyl ester carboxylesterase